MTTGERIKEARKRAGLTQKQLADKLGISYVGISQWENNQRNPKLETLQRIADALGVDVETIGGVSWNEISFSHNVYDFLREKLGYEEGAKEINIPDELFIKLSRASSVYEQRMLIAFNRLNLQGQQAAATHLEELAEIPRYQKTPPQDEAQDGEEGGV